MDRTHFARRNRRTWRTRTRELELGSRTIVMGVLNITPDSFSDGGKFVTAEDAVTAALAMLRDGADILDIGGESTRPGSTPVPADDELQRVMPVIEGILRAKPDAILSIDTSKAEVARAAVLAGAEIVNDVSGLLWDPDLAAVCAELACGVIVMHTRGRPDEWRTLPKLPREEIVPLVREQLSQQVSVAEHARVARERIAIDPGFGFGKLGDENYALLAGLPEICALGLPMVAGVSRKSFLGTAIADRSGLAHTPPPQQRDAASANAAVALVLAGADVVRAHNIPATAEAVAIADAILAATVV